MPDRLTMAAVVYAAGVVLGLALTDAPPATRLILALVWPLGPAAFVVTVSVLLATACIAFPTFGGLVAAAAAGWWALT